MIRIFERDRPVLMGCHNVFARTGGHVVLEKVYVSRSVMMAIRMCESDSTRWRWRRPLRGSDDDKAK